MNKNTTNNKINKKIKDVFKPFTLHRTVQNIDIILQSIIGSVNEHILAIQRRKYLERFCLKMSYLQYIDYNKMYLNQYQPTMTILDHLNTDDQPNNILMDNLSSYQVDSIKINANKRSCLRESSMKSIIQSNIKSFKEEKKKTISVKLPLEIIEEKEIVGLMRKERIDRELKLKNSSLQNSIIKFGENVGFDYNGQIIKIKPTYQQNLVQSLLKQNLKNQKITKKKETDNISERSQTIKSPVEKKYKFKNRDKQGRSQSINFQQYQGQPLIQDIQMRLGIRYSHDFLQYQPRPKKLQSLQLKRNLGRKKMSKDQFKLIKDLKTQRSQQKYEKFKTQAEILPRSTHSRAFSENNLHKNRFIRDSINIINPQLRQSLLIKLSDYDPYLCIQREAQQDQSQIIYEKRIQKESVKEPSVAEKNQFPTVQSRVSSSSKLTPKLPILNIRKPSKQFNQSDLILTRLQNQLKNKLKI